MADEGKKFPPIATPPDKRHSFGDTPVSDKDLKEREAYVARGNRTTEAALEKLELARRQAEAADTLAKIRAAEGEAKLAEIRGGGTVRTEGGVKITTYPSAPDPKLETAGPGSSGIGARLAEERSLGLPDHAVGRHALKEPYSGGARIPTRSPFEGVAGRAARAMAPLEAIKEGVETPMTLGDAKDLLNKVSEEHHLKLSTGAKLEYQALYLGTKITEAAPLVHDTNFLQSRLISWGKRNNIPAEALTKLQMTDFKLTKDEMEQALAGGPVAKADIPAATVVASADTTQSRSGQIEQPSKLIGGMANVKDDLVQPLPVAIASLSESKKTIT